MRSLAKKNVWIVAALAGVALTWGCLGGRDKPVDFSADVKPILNKKCITCHGGVRAKAGFSVLFREEALANTDSGRPAIIPGNPAASELIRRIKEKDADRRMPYKHEPLSDEEIDVLTRWVKQGAKWGDHWAYLPVKPVPAPALQSSWPVNDVDRFILEKQQQLGLQPSAPVDKPTLLRRVSLDLTGVYPSPGMATRFLNSNDPRAYEMLVDSLLASPRFGERWASLWLDLARYADSKGYEADHGRQIWRYRDWVINAFNKDQPYNEFLRDQIAGDLLPHPTDAQYIATAFNRNTMTNDEGGTDNEEFRTAAVLDRINTTWEGLMGTTFACVQCHSHPYDPFRHDEFYSFMAYFNNTRDEDQNPEYPFLRLYNDTLQQQLDLLTNWVKQGSNAEEAEATRLFLKTLQPSVYGSDADSLVNAYIDGNNGPLALRNHSFCRLRKIDLRHATQLIFTVYAQHPGGTLSVHLDAPDGPLAGKVIIPDTRKTGAVIMPISSDRQVHDVFLQYNDPSLPPGFAKDRLYFEWFAFTSDLPQPGSEAYRQNKAVFTRLLNTKTQTVPVIIENPASMQRTTRVFERGNRMTLGKEVHARVPQSLAFAMPRNAPANRLGLVMWLTDKRNPLVSRTLVNRVWEQLFGTGIVETLEDMGTQGTPPTHQALLDHYSWAFMNDLNWSMKKLIKTFVMSATYRQDSRWTDELRQKDPANRYYARGPRVRLQAEQLRDQALCISGVLSDKMFGPPVMPWQPSGIWSNPYNLESWINSAGEDQYRRSVYTFLKRTGTYPSLLSFDATSRTVCTARRVRTNTPLQALTTLNDSAYVDLAGHFADRMLRESGGDPVKALEQGYQIMTFKSISPEKLAVLKRLYDQAVASFGSDPSALKQFTPDAGASKAALKVVANTMLNLDEVITKN